MKATLCLFLDIFFHLFQKFGFLFFVLFRTMNWSVSFLEKAMFSKQQTTILLKQNSFARVNLIKVKSTSILCTEERKCRRNEGFLV